MASKLKLKNNQGDTLTIENSDVSSARGDLTIDAGKVYNRVNDVVSVKDFGAKGDGITDDTTAIQNAINDNNSVIYLPIGVYKISSSLTISNDIKIIGDNAEIKWLDGVSQNMITVNGCKFECHGVMFTGGTKSQADNTLTQRAIQITGPSQRVNIANCEFNYFDLVGVYLVSSELQGTVIENINISNNSFRGNDTQLQAITCFGGENAVINGNVIDGCDSVAILVDDATTTTALASYARCRKFVISNNVIAMPDASNPSVNYGIQTCSVEALTITGNVISNNSTTGGWGIVSSIYDLGQQASAPGGGSAYLPLSEENARCVIANNSVYNVGIGIRVEGYKAPIVSGNNVTCTSTGIYIGNEAGTVDSVAYTFPSDDLSDANVIGNVIVSKDVAAIGMFLQLPGNYVNDNVFSQTFAKRYQNVGVAALSDQYIRDADGNTQSTLFDYNGDSVSFNDKLTTTKAIRKVTTTSISDSVAKTVATISTTDEASGDGGAYTVLVHVLATHTATSTTSYSAGKGGMFQFSVAQMSSGAINRSAVSSIATSNSAATNAGIRDIGTISFSLNGVDNYTTELQITVDLTGGSVSGGTATVFLELIYDGYTTPPVIS